MAGVGPCGFRGRWLMERRLLGSGMAATNDHSPVVVSSTARSQLANLIRERRRLLASSAGAMVRLRRTLQEHRAEVEAAQSSRRIRQGP